MRLPRIRVFASFLLTAILAVPAWGYGTSSSPSNSAIPGTLNYVEGTVSIGSEVLNSKSIGSAEMQPGQSITTRNGKAEVLLTPGVFLRIGSNSSAKMISPNLTDTELAVDWGEIIVEVDEIHPENDIRISAHGTTAKLLKTGLYDFDESRGQLRVFEGKAAVEDTRSHATVKGGHEVSLVEDAPLKSRKFNKKEYEEGDLYRWSSLRSAYVAEANVDAASLYAGDEWGPWGWGGWWGAGWYWDPWFDAFTFIPADGIFYSPFGWGFYSPWSVYDAPLFGYGPWGGSPPVRRHFSDNYHAWGPGNHYVGSPRYSSGIYHGPGSVGGFHSGSRMGGVSRGFGLFGSGGFHSSGHFSSGVGGFHGGGLSSGGGFHGGGFSSGGGFSGGGFHGR